LSNCHIRLAIHIQSVLLSQALPSVHHGHRAHTRPAATDREGRRLIQVFSDRGFSPSRDTTGESFPGPVAAEIGAGMGRSAAMGYIYAEGYGDAAHVGATSDAVGRLALPEARFRARLSQRRPAVEERST
jgi:hypothetical protein